MHGNSQNVGNPVELTDRVRAECATAFANVLKINSNYAITRDKGYYGIILAMPSKNLRNILSVDREILILITTFEEQQARTIQTAKDLISESSGRLDSTAVVVLHNDLKGNVKLKSWGREQGLSVLPIYFGRGVPTGRALLRALAHELFSHDPFDVTGPVADDSQFYGRRDEARELARKLQNGHIRSCFGIRKIGKTSILHRIIKEARENFDCSIVLVDGQSDAVFELSAAQLLNSIADTVEKLECEPGQVNMSVMAEAVELPVASERLRSAVGRHPRQVVVAFDEVDYLTPTSPTAIHWRSEFNPFWRNIRTIYQSTGVKNGNLSLFVSGVSSKWFAEESIDGVENAALLFIPEEYLSPLPRGAAVAMMKRLGKMAGLSFPDPVAEYIASASADMPFWIRKACSYIHSKIEIHVRPYELSIEDVERYLSEFVDSDGVAMSEVALAHLFRVYPELKVPALQCASKDTGTIPTKYLRSLEKYGVLKNSKNPVINGKLVEMGLKYFENDIAEISSIVEPVPVESHSYGDWADEIAVISRRRNVIERRLRSIVANFIRFSALNSGEKISAKERVIRCIDSRRKGDLNVLSLDDIMEKIYWLELVAIVKKEWGLFERIFGDRAEFGKFADIVNERPDAHAKKLDEFEIAYHRKAIGWFEDRLSRI